MTSTPRRTFLKQTAATAMLPLISGMMTSCTDLSPRIRYNALSPEGQSMIRKYARAVQIMKSKAAGDPFSWTYWWYVHASPMSKSEAIQQVFGDASSPAENLAQMAWWTCQPHQAGESLDNFLPWHRMALFFFEKQIGVILGDDTFTLPYWNYCPGLPSSQSGIMPKAFRSPNDPLLASLYVQDRNTGVNSGSPIDSQYSGLLNPATALGETTFSSHSPKQGFSNYLDFGVHGFVHTLVGTDTNMGYIPASAQDPVFWIHHCNIDRIWASWNRAGFRNPTHPDFLGQVFWFPGPDGEAASIKFGDVMSTEQLNYTYQEFEPAPLAPSYGPSPRLRNLAPGVPIPTTIVASATTVSLGEGATNIQVKATPEAKNHIFNLLLATPPAPDLGAYYLVIRDLRIKAQPGVIYSLYLDLPENASNETVLAHKVGDLSFFHAMPGMEMDEPTRFVSYDITELVKRLGISASSASVSLTVISSGQPAAGSEPVIGSITIQAV